MTGGSLTTHVLDTVNGIPAEGMKVELFRLSDKERFLLKSVTTNEAGRTGGPILPEEEFSVGSYELVFHVGGYFGGEAAPFLREVPVRFRVSDAGSHYHVPLLCSPYSYSTYRGS